MKKVTFDFDEDEDEVGLPDWSEQERNEAEKERMVEKAEQKALTKKQTLELKAKQ